MTFFDACGRGLAVIWLAAVLIAWTAHPAAAVLKPRHPSPSQLLADQNRAIDRLGLERLADRSRLGALIAAGQLVAIKAQPSYYPDFRHVGSQDRQHAWMYGYARPWVKAFLDVEVSRISRLAHGQRFKITSLVRTRAYQQRLRRRNPAAASGRTHLSQSPHLSGAVVDISTRYLSALAKGLIIRRLKILARSGAIIFMNESLNNCLHVFVLPDWQSRLPQGRRQP